MKKTLLSKMSAVIMSAALAVSFVSCGGNGGDPKPPTPEKPTIKIEVSNITDCSAEVSFTPSDNEMMYIAQYMPVSAFTSAEEIIADQKEYMEMVASQYQMDLADVIEQLTMTGAQENIPMGGLDPETKYYVFAFGIDLEGNALTDFVKAEVATKKLVRQDVTFTIDATATDTIIDVTVTPSDPNALYYFDIAPKANFTDVPTCIESLLAFYAQMGYSASDVCEGLASKGTDGYKFDGVEPNTTYVVFAVGINTAFIPNSDAATKEITTAASASASVYAPALPAYRSLRTDKVDVNANPFCKTFRFRTK
ncbi:MAG: hypothetical protein ACI3Z7_07610 [Candidatus Aphodosoma sp.]